jgi:hypothetical protein
MFTSVIADYIHAGGGVLVIRYTTITLLTYALTGVLTSMLRAPLRIMLWWWSACNQIHNNNPTNLLHLLGFNIDVTRVIADYAGGGACQMHNSQPNLACTY